MDLQERIAWRNYTQNPCPETAFAWARTHARTIVAPEDIPLDDIEGMGNRERNVLKGAGIDTFDKLANAYRTQLGYIGGCGPACRNKIIGFLAANGIKLKRSPKTDEERQALCKSIPIKYYNAYCSNYIKRVRNNAGQKYLPTWEWK